MLIFGSHRLQGVNWCLQICYLYLVYIYDLMLFSHAPGVYAIEESHDLLPQYVELCAITTLLSCYNCI